VRGRGKRPTKRRRSKKKLAKRREKKEMGDERGIINSKIPRKKPGMGGTQ